MLPAEAEWIGSRLAEFGDIALSTVLELGSSTPEFRRLSQPYIYEQIDGPLIRRGTRLVYCDNKSAAGIDISGNIFEASIQDKIREIQPDCLLCCNIFEHVEDRLTFAKICDSLVKPGAYLLVTVPRSYPIHLDPIDTYFRPTPAEIHQMFPNYELLAGSVVKGGSYFQQLFGDRRALSARLTAVVKALLSPARPRNWFVLNHRLLWLFRRYKVSAVLLRKDAATR